MKLFKNFKTKRQLKEENDKLKEENEKLKERLELMTKNPPPLTRVYRKAKKNGDIIYSITSMHGLPMSAQAILNGLKIHIEYDFLDTEDGKIYYGTMYIFPNQTSKRGD